MEIDWFYRFVFLFVTLIFSAFFSGSEVALFSLDKKRFESVREDSLLVRYILQLLEAPRRLLVTILLGNTLFNVAASILSVSIALNIAELYEIPVDIALIIQIVLLTVLVLIIGEVTPKVVASKHPVIFSKIVCVPLYWISVVLYPIAKILTDIIKAATAKINFDKSKTAILSSELSDLAELSAEKGTQNANP